MDLIRSFGLNRLNRSDEHMWLHLSRLIDPFCFLTAPRERDYRDELEKKNCFGEKADQRTNQVASETDERIELLEISVGGPSNRTGAKHHSYSIIENKLRERLGKEIRKVSFLFQRDRPAFFHSESVFAVFSALVSHSGGWTSLSHLTKRLRNREGSISLQLREKKQRV